MTLNCISSLNVLLSSERATLGAPDIVRPSILLKITGSGIAFKAQRDHPNHHKPTEAIHSLNIKSE